MGRARGLKSDPAILTRVSLLFYSLADNMQMQEGLHGYQELVYKGSVNYYTETR